MNSWRECRSPGNLAFATCLHPLREPASAGVDCKGTAAQTARPATAATRIALFNMARTPFSENLTNRARHCSPLRQLALLAVRAHACRFGLDQSSAWAEGSSSSANSPVLKPNFPHVQLARQGACMPFVRHSLNVARLVRLKGEAAAPSSLRARPEGTNQTISS